MGAIGPENAYIFRIVHIQNVPTILEKGVCCRNAHSLDPGYVQIGNPELIDKRKHKPVPMPPGGTLSDYVPFYFTPFSPMLYNIKTGYNGITKRPMCEIVILVTSLRKVAEDGYRFLFTDRHAYLQAAQFFSSLDDLDKVDWTILKNRDFKRDYAKPEKFERYQAEALIHESLPVNGLMGMVCYRDSEKSQLDELVRERSLQLRVRTRPDWFF